MPTLLQRPTSWRGVLLKARQVHPEEGRDVYTYAKTVTRLANASKLSQRDMIELALHLGMKVFPRKTIFRNYLGESNKVVAGLPKNWIPLLNEAYFSLSYHNPEDQLEYIAVVPSSSGSLPYIIHHTSEGYVDPNWFNQTVPVLFQLSLENRVKSKLGKAFRDQKLTLGQVNTVNHFFKADPILKIKGVCTKCYQVSLPKKGFGVRYYYDGNPKELPLDGFIKEIRFSARKSLSEGPTSIPYVTELVIANSKMLVETDEKVIRQAKKMNRFGQ